MVKIIKSYNRQYLPRIYPRHAPNLAEMGNGHSLGHFFQGSAVKSLQSGEARGVFSS